MRMSPWAVAYLIQDRVGVETVLHFPTRGRNLLRVQGDLLATHAMGVRNVFVVMGDPTQIGDYPEAFDTHDVVPSGLIRIITQQLNLGVDQAGNSINQPTSFFVGTALSLNHPDIDKEVRLLKKKINAGAGFALSQPVYDPYVVERFLKRYETVNGHALEIPVLVGVLPLYTPRHVAFLQNEVPGIDIPEKVRDRINAADDPADEGVRVAQELVNDLKDLAQGIYLMPPFAKYHLAAEVIDALTVPAS
jgi:homocysteine S-methyltransferase